MKVKNLVAWSIIATLTCSVYAQSKKPVVPAAATPVKTAKVLASRLAAAPRTPAGAKATKNATPATKASAKPVVATKLTKTPATRKQAASEKAIQSAVKTKQLKATPGSKLAAKDLRTKSQRLALNNGERKGKFGKAEENIRARRNEPAPIAETKRELKPSVPKRSTELVASKRDEDQRDNEQTSTRRIRPRMTEEEDETRDSVKNKTKDNDDQRSAAEERIADAPKLPIARPDRIEIIEADSPQITQLLALPNTRPTASYGAIITRTNTPPSARKDINIPQQRVFEIQYELAKRGFYTAEPNGLYDDVTVASMWEFQKNYGLPATGYPTAHSLKRLGLTSW